MNILLCLIITFASVKDITLEAFKKLKKSELTLDINGNGIADYFREFNQNGKISSIKFDQNEDGKTNYMIKVDENGFKAQEFIDRNYDGKIDYQITCTPEGCKHQIDDDFDGHFESEKSSGPQRFLQTKEKSIEIQIFERIIEVRKKLFK